MHADTLLVDIEHVGCAGAGGNGERLGGKGGMSSDDTVAIVEGVPLDAVTVLSNGIVDRVGRAATTCSIDRVEA